MINVFSKNEGFDADCCIYMNTKREKTIIVSLYMDDLLIASNCKTLCAKLKVKTQ